MPTTKNDYLTISALRERGWTETTVRKHLGPPDATKPNPYYQSATPMRLYQRQRVEEAESTTAWVEARSRVERRREGATKAIETKKQKLLAQLDTLEVAAPKLPMDTLMQRACAHYNERQFQRRLHRNDPVYFSATAACAPEFLARIRVNYLRHCLTRYEEELETIAGRVGVREGYAEINRRVYAAIASAYPSLADECQRQMSAKLAIL